MRSAVFLGVLGLSTVAWASGPSIVVHTTDGSVYYGEIVEKVENDHVTLQLVTGVKRFAWKDIDPTLPPVPPKLLVDEPTPGPTDTVRTKDGSVYHGEIIEKIPGDHVTLKLATGDVRRIGDADIDTSPPPQPTGSPRQPPPVENILTKNGSIYHGEILEKIVGDHVTIRLGTGTVENLAWEDLVVEPAHPLSRAPATARRDTMVSFHAASDAVLERLDPSTHRYSTVCHGPCDEPDADVGLYRIAGPGVVPSHDFRVALGNHRIEASVGYEPMRVAGEVALISSGPTGVGGVALAFAAANANPYYGSNGSALDTMAVLVNVAAGALLVAGVCLLVMSSTWVSLDGAHVAKRSRVGLGGVHF